MFPLQHPNKRLIASFSLCFGPFGRNSRGGYTGRTYSVYPISAHHVGHFYPCSVVFSLANLLLDTLPTPVLWYHQNVVMQHTARFRTIYHPLLSKVKAHCHPGVSGNPDVDRSGLELAQTLFSMPPTCSLWCMFASVCRLLCSEYSAPIRMVVPLLSASSVALQGLSRAYE